VVDVVKVVLEVVGAVDEVVVDCVVEEVVLEVVGDMEVVVVMDDAVEVALEVVGAEEEVVVDEAVEVEIVEVVDEVLEAVVVLVEAAAMYWKVIVPLTLFESTAAITYVPVTHAGLPPTDVV
jgi:hypothetical protein